MIATPRSAALRSVLAIALLLGGCSLPEGHFACTSDSDCPSGWSCRSDGLCYATPFLLDGAVPDVPRADSGGVCPPVDQRDHILVSGEVPAGTVWTCEHLYELDGIVRVRTGTLTIEPDVQVVALGNDALVVHPEATLLAEGTAQAPIVFTSAGTIRQRGDWGGVVLLGSAPVNGAGAQLDDIPDTAHGGGDPSHSCGSLRYVRIEFSGAAPPAAGTPIPFNGLTLAGCGDATSVSFVQVHLPLADAFSVRGGTVRMDHLIAIGWGDHGLAWNYGWTGGAQFVIAQERSPGVSNAIYGENHPTLPDTEPRSAPSLWNMSVLGGRNDTRAMLWQNGSYGIAQNTIIANFARECIAVTAESEPAIPASVRVESSILWNCGLDGVSYTVDAVDATALVSVRFADPLLESPDLGTAPDFRPTTASPALTMAATPTAPFDSAATFVGALGREDWTLSWASYPSD